VDPGRLPLATLRARLEADQWTAARGLIAALRRDPRAGARQLARQLERRARGERGERARLARLFALQDELAAAGAVRIAGVDEVGMGPLAGPVVAAAVVLPPGARLRGLRDSKQLAPAARARLDAQIRELALDLCVAWLEPAEIDRLNIHRAGLEAMRRAVAGLRGRPDWLLVDARHIPGTPVPQRALVRGDATVGAIAAASIVAKVWRDARMRELDRAFPGYGFARNSGYATPEHRRALRERGPSPVHRRSFAPVTALEVRCRTP
jgi:ribonuclease HII